MRMVKARDLRFADQIVHITAALLYQDNARRHPVLLSRQYAVDNNVRACLLEIGVRYTHVEATRSYKPVNNPFIRKACVAWHLRKTNEEGDV